MSNIICTNEVGGSGSRMSPERRCAPFVYDRDKCKYPSQGVRASLNLSARVTKSSIYFFEYYISNGALLHD